MITLNPVLDKTVRELSATFSQIPTERIAILNQVVAYIKQKKSEHMPVRLNFICTHNSRRSHLAQIWAQTAAAYYKVDGILCYSGGTEATQFNPNAVAAMSRVGFEIRTIASGENPLYEIGFSKDAPAFNVFSKRFDDAANPAKDFAAIMVCSAEDCPFVPGADVRIPVKFQDPKEADGTPNQDNVYLERAHEIGREMLYVFSMVN